MLHAEIEIGKEYGVALGRVTPDYADLTQCVVRAVDKDGVTVEVSGGTASGLLMPTPFHVSARRVIAPWQWCLDQWGQVKEARQRAWEAEMAHARAQVERWRPLIERLRTHKIATGGRTTASWQKDEDTRLWVALSPEQAEALLECGAIQPGWPEKAP